MTDYSLSQSRPSHFTSWTLLFTSVTTARKTSSVKTVAERTRPVTEDSQTLTEAIPTVIEPSQILREGSQTLTEPCQTLTDSDRR